MENSKPKYWFVAWEGYSADNQPEGRHANDRLCLQGPHSLEKARAMANEMRGMGMLASVIDCTESLRPKDEMREALIAAFEFLGTVKAPGELHLKLANAINNSKGNHK